MNKLEGFLEEIKELSDTSQINDAHEMQLRLEDINVLTIEFYESIYHLMDGIDYEPLED